MPPLYNHGHADALSITLSKAGQMILVDPGTYRYNGAEEWRRYFKGTRAHNTISIDGLDQSIQETGFIWSRPYHTELLMDSHRSGNFVVKALHDGYSRLKNPVWHTRTILFIPESSFLIKDSFHGEGVHSYQLNFHLHPDTTPKVADGWWCLNHQTAKVYLKLLPDNNLHLIRGQLNPIHGWFSPRYGIKRKSYVLHCKRHGFPNQVNFLTAVCTEFPADMNQLQQNLIYFED